MKRFMEVALVLAILLLTGSAASAQFTNPPPSPFTQATFSTSTSFLGGVAFAPNGDVWADDCSYSGGTLFRFPLQGEHPTSSSSATPGLTGCGLTNHPNGKLYSNTDHGVAEISNPVTGAPALLRTIGLAGNGLGITVDPQTKHLVYVGTDCGGFAESCTIYDVDPSSSEPSSSTLVVLPGSVATYVDGIAFDPSGNFLLLSTRSPSLALTILTRAGVLVQQVSNDTCNDGCTHEPDGIAFHVTSPTFVVTDNTDGTMSRFDFPSNNLALPPNVTQFASGGRRGDLSQVGPDGCLYISQDLNPDVTGDVSDIAQICGGFAQLSQTVTLQFTTSSGPETKIATVGNPTDPDAQSLALTLASVTNPINVSVTFFYEPTDLSTGTHGVGIADGVCELGATEDQDFDCRLAATNPTPPGTSFVYPDGGTLTAGDRLVPHIIPSHNFLGVWVRVIATRASNGMPAVAGVDYTGPVSWYYAWNTNPLLAPGGLSGSSQNPVAPGAVNPEYSPGWNNMNPQMYDRPGTNLDPAFVFNITTYSKDCTVHTCVGTADPGVGGKTPTLNDIVVAAPPNPPGGAAAFGTVEPVLPFPGISPFPYFKGLPMLVSFELEKPGTETSITNALTLPHSVNVATLDALGNNIPVQFLPGFPTTFKYSPFSKTYYIFLSSAPYKTDGTKYTLQINSDLFAQPVTATFVVKKF